MSSNGRPGEPRFNIQPHPARTNNPADLDPRARRDFNENPAILAHHARDPYIPSQDVVNSLGAPLSREELKRRSEELNRDQ
ncbi:hypothetical protein EDD16DRAFT_1174155 [Pisolithus croceorrhizus]|nr:hypothetical protein EDD16DRAFT_1174155 [Pisolithus croceorrhizus]KAI6125960.1 hypothetical protein EV401DRAFT_1936181 [Pisolithus croceorrhizus]KAI6169753.1 hypothetical protein EDD17DRAFT_1868651 [Pisolithus thermaeus]